MRLKAAASASLIVIAVGACSNDDQPTPDLTAIATDFEFTPTEWTMDAGESTIIEFSNEGSENHEWAVMTLDGKVTSEQDFVSEDQVLLEVESIPAGETVLGRFTIDEPGTYQVTCLLEGHFDQGMEGTLIVR